MVSSRYLTIKTHEEWETIREHALKSTPFPLIFNHCPYITVHITKDCLFAIVPERHQENLILRLCIIPKPKKQPPDIDKEFWDKMENEARGVINLVPRSPKD